MLTPKDKKALLKACELIDTNSKKRIPTIYLKAMFWFGQDYWKDFDEDYETRKNERLTALCLFFGGRWRTLMDKKQARDLKPCPFCGSDDVIITCESPSYPMFLCAVQCLNCKSKSGLASNEYLVMKSWNKRMEASKLKVPTLGQFEDWVFSGGLKTTHDCYYWLIEQMKGGK